MKWTSRLAAVLVVMIHGADASGYTLFPPDWYCGGSYIHWARPANPGIRVISQSDRCITQDGWFSGNPSYGSMMNAGGWAHWMWYRE